MTRSLLALALSIGWLVPARGAPLAPTKPSQIVTLQPEAFIGTPPCTGTQLGVTRVVNPDLSTGPLVIPVVRPGQTICAELASENDTVAVTVVANGYFTKDK